MSDLTVLRARLRDRQQKAGPLATSEVDVCLEPELIGHLDILTAQRDDAGSGRSRLGGTPENEPDPDLEAEIAAKEEEVRAAMTRLVFRALPSTKYQELENKHPDSNRTSELRAEFLKDLAGACLQEVWQNDERTVVPEGQGRGVLDDFGQGAFFGEWDAMIAKVWALNLRTVDVPFSLRPSGATRRR